MLVASGVGSCAIVWLNEIDQVTLVTYSPGGVTTQSHETTPLFLSPRLSSS